MLVSEKRPRNLSWIHAGPLLFGDWGTSRLYVLGLAFFYTAHASVFYLAALSVLMAAVAWAYTIICRCFPSGGGVYSAARQISPLLAVLGATALIGDYVVTASLSTVEAFHYFGVSDEAPIFNVVTLSIAAIVGLGAVNWLGARSAGRLALIIAVASLSLSLLVALACLPFAGEGARNLTVPTGSPGHHWVAFVHIVLALSGVEAVANMTGLMKEPVPRTARRTIWPVLAEVALLNLLFGLAVAGLPELVAIHTPDADRLTGEAPEHVRQYRDTAMEMLAIESGQYWLGETAGFIFGRTASVVFGLLLLSASNTAIMAMVSVLYAAAQDRELPRALTKLNYSGVPWVALVLAVGLPVLVLSFESDVAGLADLYAIGVTGAIAMNVLCCAFNRRLPIGTWERRGMWSLGILMASIWLTIAVTKPHATLFGGALTAAVLAARFVVRWRLAAAPERIPEPVTGWLAEVNRPIGDLAPGRPRIMLAARGRQQAEYAVQLARERGAILFAIYVRTLRVLDVGPDHAPRIEDDPPALESLGTIALLARQMNVPFVPIYVRGTDIAEEILDYTVTFGCDTLIMGKTARRAFTRAIAGDVVARVAQHLPDGVALITREATPHTMGLPHEPSSRPSPAANTPGH